MQDGCTRGTANAKVWVNHKIILIRQCKYEPLDKLNRKLAWMDGLFHMVVLHVGNYPHVTRILAERIA
jgi:hypothetical protein